MFFSTTLLLTTFSLALARPQQASSVSSTAAAAASTGTPSNGSGFTSADKLVFAHFMNTDSAQWSRIAPLASTAGIDAFAINVAPPSTGGSKSAVTKAFTDCQSAQCKVFISFDQNIGYDWNASTVASWINEHKALSSQLLIDGLPVVSTFAGDGWAGNWRDVIAQTGELFLLPEWENMATSEIASYQDVVKGAMTWGVTAWPTDQGKASSDVDKQWKSALEAFGGKYVMPVSPWMYVDSPAHYGKAWFREGDTLWFDRWQQVLELQPQYLEIVTWNDYIESHYIGPLDTGGIEGVTEESWYIDDIPHTGWLDSLPLLTAAFKASSSAPSVSEDNAIFWYRTTSAASGCSTDNVPCGQGSQLPILQCVEDNVYIMTFTQNGGSLKVTIGGSEKEVTAKKGLDLVSVPFGNGVFGAVEVSVGGKTAKGGKEIESGCPDGRMSFNPVVGSTFAA